MRAGRFVALAAAFLVSSLAALEADAYSSGVGRSMPACGGCHSGGTTPAVTFMVGSVPAASAHAVRGQTLSLGFRVTSPSTAQRRAGFSATGPFPLAPGTGVAAVPPSTVQHTSPKNSTGSTSEFRFNVTIPASEPCNVIRTLTGWGTAANGDGTANGDGNAVATLKVTIDCPPSLAAAVTPPGPATGSGPAITLPRLSEGDAAQVLWGWLQTSNHYRMPTRHFATRNARLVERDWTFELVLACCAQGELVDVWRVDSATKLVSRQTAPGVFVRP